MRLILKICVKNVYSSIKNKHFVFIVSRYISIQVMMGNSGFSVRTVEDGFIANALIMTHRSIQILNVLSARKALTTKTKIC